jgi:histidine ammonia-lyase
MNRIKLTQVFEFLHRPSVVKLPRSAVTKILASRAVVMNFIARGQTVYGINTGFGRLSMVKIPEGELADLQVNLLRSHACGVGQAIPSNIVALMMYLKIHNLAAGYSGCSLAIIEKLIELLNQQIYPVIPSRGSVGASGDLAPLAHLSLPLIGEGEVEYQGQIVAAGKLVKDGIYQPVVLGPKDGLSLINGTQYSTALLIYALAQTKNLFLLAELAAAMSTEAVLATDAAFGDAIQKVRGQQGQRIIARQLRNFLKDSQIIKSHVHCGKVQDPYSFRCVPQVMGAVYDTIHFVQQIAENEINAVTDNPLVFSADNKIISGGNFHAEPIALAADYLTVALTELGNISERRIATLADPTLSSLPPFLIDNSGLNSGFMIAHVTAAALCAENRTLAHPASAENIPTSANQEDHVSMAPNAGLKLLRVVENLSQIVWIEFIAAAQGIDYRQNLLSGEGTRLAYRKIRSLVEHLAVDRQLYLDLRKSTEFYNDLNFINQISEIANQENH